MGRCSAPELFRARQVQTRVTGYKSQCLELTLKMLIQASLSIIQDNWSAIQPIPARLK